MLNRIGRWIDTHPIHLMGWGYVLIVAILMALGLGFASGAKAADATVTWTNPTQNTDGSAIPATGTGSLTQTRVEWGSCSAPNVFGTKAGEMIVPAPGTSTTIVNLPAGTTACFRAFSKNTYGVESAASVTVSKDFAAPIPKPPVLSSTITVAYEVKQNSLFGPSLGRVVGSIARGTPCDEEPIVYTARGIYYGVPLDKVTLKRAPKSAIVVTKCEAS